MKPALLAVVLLSTAATAGPRVSFLDGERLDVAELLVATPDRTSVRLATGVWDVPTRNIVSVDFRKRKAVSSRTLYNLYLADGGRLHGTVTGAGDRFQLVSADVKGLKVDLASIRAIRFGRLLEGLQAKYDNVFRENLVRGRDAVIVQRDTKPFPISARVLAVKEKTLTIRVGDNERDIALHKVYGFVRQPSDEERGEAPAVMRVRAFMSGGARVTLPLEEVGSGEWIKAGGASLRRASTERVEFLGPHMAHVADFDPIAVKEVALFGRARPYRPNEMVLGGTMRMNRKAYAHGVGVHAFSRLEYVLGKRWKSFFVRCGIDDAAGSEGEAVFRVIGDGKVLMEVTCRRRGGRTHALKLDVGDVDRLVLEVAPGASYASDLCNWADARVFNADPVAYPEKKQ
jgi:hypothetical protein